VTDSVGFTRMARDSCAMQQWRKTAKNRTNLDGIGAGNGAQKRTLDGHLND